LENDLVVSSVLITLEVSPALFAPCMRYYNKVNGRESKIALPLTREWHKIRTGPQPTTRTMGTVPPP
jgi:hypothetical protein